jgi:hypothetical protein
VAFLSSSTNHQNSPCHHIYKHAVRNSIFVLVVSPCVCVCVRVSVHVHVCRTCVAEWALETHIKLIVDGRFAFQ